MSEEIKKELNQEETQAEIQIEELNTNKVEQVSGGGGWKKRVLCYVPGCTFSTKDPVTYRRHMQDVHGQKYEIKDL